MIQQSEIATALGLTRGRVSQLVKMGMPTESVEAARAWRAERQSSNERAGHIAQPVRPLDLSGLDDILQAVSQPQGGGDEMDVRIQQQVELCRMTREVFVNALENGDPAQGKLYGNYDRAIGTLLALEKVRKQRQVEDGRLVDADEAAARFSKVLGQLRSLLDRAELTFAPKANPDNPPKALKAYREFKEDIFRKISEYGVQVEDGSPRIGEDVVTPPPVGTGEGDGFSEGSGGGDTPTAGEVAGLEWTAEESDDE